jgi:hypothetical protein
MKDMVLDSLDRSSRVAKNWINSNFSFDTLDPAAMLRLYKQRGVEIKSLIGSLFPSLEPSDFDHQAKKMIGGGVSLI